MNERTLNEQTKKKEEGIQLHSFTKLLSKARGSKQAVSGVLREYDGNIQRLSFRHHRLTLIVECGSF
jgi:hypothetical protein